MSFIDRLKKKLGDLAGGARSEAAAQKEKGESDVAGDSAVAGSRAGDDGADGDYVGRTSPVFDAETEPSGAEARTEDKRGSQ